ncbi:MAG: methyltransferase domain-containing protein [Clostridia bacterium]|nr:methyltransferase domain-containing protein [Clostridia bacterium]MBN2882269.1 methyltransferase domain-containing protein [Clostridia bacterium]
MYRDTAEIYDKLTSGIDYAAYAGYFIELINRYKGINTHSLLETGCGSGNLTRLLALAGYDMTGVDSSAEMLSEAYTKDSPGILWVNQDVLELDLFGTYDAAVSFLDFPNHITDPADLGRYFALIENYLNPGGLYIFDINSEYKFRNILAENVFYYDDDDYSCIWQNSYNEKNRICSMEITLFKQEGKLFRRSDTCNYERAYSNEELIKIIESSGLSVIEVFGDLKFEKPVETEERIFFICRKEYNE